MKVQVSKIKGGATITNQGRTEYPDYYEATVYHPEKYYISIVCETGPTRTKARAAAIRKAHELAHQLLELK